MFQSLQDKFALNQLIKMKCKNVVHNLNDFIDGTAIDGTACTAAM